MPTSVDAYSVSRACATSYQSTTDLAESIMAGQVLCGIAGGAESASDAPITVSRRLADALVSVNKARSLRQRLAAFRNLRPGDIVPVPPALREPCSDYGMGEAAEKMARENRISREAQDEFAHRSHTNASRAWDQGFFDDQVMHAYVPPDYEVCIRDNLVRADSALEAYEKLKPVFDRVARVCPRASRPRPSDRRDRLGPVQHQRRLHIPRPSVRRDRRTADHAGAEGTEADRAIKVLVFASGKPDSFVAGADLDMLLQIREAQEGKALSQASQRVQRRIAALEPATVAAIHGPCLGGGLELALAFEARVASTHEKTRLGPLLLRRRGRLTPGRHPLGRFADEETGYRRSPGANGGENREINPNFSFYFKIYLQVIDYI